MNDNDFGLVLLLIIAFILGSMLPQLAFIPALYFMYRALKWLFS